MDRPRHRPRNRQPRPSQQQNPSSRGGKSHRPRAAPAAATPQQNAGTIPPSRLIVPGTRVFIVQKHDQPTGRETQGVVQDVLTAGDHPRGVKVRLRDGRVGRVQRLDGAGAFSEGVGVPAASASSSPAGSFATGTRNRYSDVRNDGHLEGPPPRTLADYMAHLDGFP